MYKPALISGALFAAISVIMGAFGAHALKEVLSPELLQTFETGVKYQFYHSFALLIVGVLYSSYNSKFIRYAAVFFIIGIILFSYSIFLLVALKKNGLVGLSGVGILTPIGGLFLILGWLMLVRGILQYKSGR